LQAEIDQSLSYINAQQEDLSSILDAYEKQMKEVLDESNLQQPMQPADIQREKAYSLAEGLNKQLDDVSRNLNIMIDEVNKMNGTEESIDDNDTEDNVSLALSCQVNYHHILHINATFVQVSQIVKILNAHLTSLQWIDNTTSAMQNKIQEINKLQDKIERDNAQTLLRR
jgi:nuclear pore complex protein Nup62